MGIAVGIALIHIDSLNEVISNIAIIIVMIKSRLENKCPVVFPGSQLSKDVIILLLQGVLTASAWLRLLWNDYR